MLIRGLCVASLLLLGVARADEPVDYVKSIKPVLQARCYACHGVLKQKAGLRLDTAALAAQGGDNGPALMPGDVDASELIARITAIDEASRMPPEGEPLKPAEIDLIKAWIQQGAKAPADEHPERDPRDHWAFKTPVRPAIPAVTNQQWVLNPIDAFIAAEYQERGLSPQRTADKRVWLRRVTIDLVGLPPTSAELASFVADDSAGAYDKVVTRLLDSPQYGERWGRHWMDIWRYSDWWGLGAEVRNSQKHIWHWRDWIIESLNADNGYDQMLREMLAADELYPNDLDRLRASGFLARQYFKFNRTSWLDETIEHTSKAMLGLTFNCAKCHDHKYDPFSQVEYYRLRAIFEPYQVRTDSVGGELDFEKDGIPRPFDCNLDAPTYLHIRGDDRNPDKSKPLAPGLPAFLTFDETKIEPVMLPPEAIQPGLRPFVVAAHVKAAEQRLMAAHTAMATARKKLTETEQKVQVASVTPTSDQGTSEPKSRVRDDFTAPQPDLWEMRDGQWSYADGKLRQSLSGPTRSALRLKQRPPADFEVKLKYVPRGGETWKSVGITFDGTDADNEIVAYLSSYAGGPKSQVSYRKGKDYLYPSEGAQMRAIALDQPHELIVRVRQTLVNVVVDGQQSIAYRLPVPRVDGHLQIITYDATAEFSSFELNELPATTVLAEAAGSKEGPLTVDQAKASVKLAEKALIVAEAQLASVKARATADAARFGIGQREPTSPEGGPSAQVVQAIRAANLAEPLLRAAQSDETVAHYELEILKATPEKLEEAKKKLSEAKLNRLKIQQSANAQQTVSTGTLADIQEQARKALGLPEVTYTSLTGSLKTLESNLETEASRSKPYPKISTGRRSALARWITDPRHPLPARVAVNHMWSRHFGKALVPTLFDFGRKGTPPTHPELLDWLAVEFVEHGWSMKHIHRLIVLSNTYRLSSSNAGASAETVTADPDNKFHWRANPIRMEAQIVRDSLLSLAGELDLTLGGPPMSISDETSRRRSLYFVHTHNEHHQFLSMFDDASVLECYRRSESIVPQQALALENSALVTSLAGKITQRVATSAGNGTDRDFIRDAFLSILTVEPTEAELATAEQALNRLRDIAKSKNRPQPEVQARTNLIQALLNHNDFVTVR